MKRFIASFLTAVGIGALAQPQKPSPTAVMSELRSRALSVKPADIGLPPEAYAGKPWGVLMETGLGDGATYTLVVLADGSTSLYFSSGGGVIGAGQHNSVHAAATAMLQVAARFQAQLPVATSTPLPSPGKVNFYLLCEKGTLAYAAPEQTLGEGTDRLSELFHAGHRVITEIRQTEQARSKVPPQ